MDGHGHVVKGKGWEGGRGIVGLLTADATPLSFRSEAAIQASCFGDRIRVTPDRSEPWSRRRLINLTSSRSSPCTPVSGKGPICRADHSFIVFLGFSSSIWT